MNTTSNRPSISIVIVTWNGKKCALECLESLQHHLCDLPVEVIVIDNASTDGTPTAIRQQFPEVVLIENDSNLGFAKANNIGIALARGEYICLINSDVVVDSECLQQMTRYMHDNETVGMLGPKMRAPDGGVGYSVMRLPTIWNTFCCAMGLHSLLPRFIKLSGYMATEFSYTKTEDVEVLTGWFWMVRRSALEQVGGLDERFFMYGEDIDWCHRFRKAGWRVVFYSEAESLHYGAASSAKAPVRFYIEMQRANLQYFRKHHGAVAGLGFLLINWVHQLIRVSGYAVLYCLNGSRRSEAAFKLMRSWSCLKWLASARVAPLQSNA